MRTRPGMLVATMDIPPEHEAEFHEWYEKEHIPERLSCPGFLTGQRYMAIKGGPKYLALYDLESLAALETPEYLYAKGPGATPWTTRMLRLAQHFSRNVLEQIFPPPDETAPLPEAIGALLLVSLDIPHADKEAFNEWSHSAQLPSLCRVPGVLRSRHFVAKERQPEDWLAPDVYLYELSQPEVLESPEWHAAYNTSWSLRNFQAHQRRWNLYRPLSLKTASR